ncbi:hypothetical protein BC332_10738 [Capsicum chinense]|nr:hypothetical protein BC332_10738 [Capsicum chinense]
MNHSSPNLGSDDLAVSEKKRKCMILNRESARQSRKRKQTHLVNLRNQSNRLKVKNRDLTNRVLMITGHCQLVRRENEMLRTESILLRQRLEGIREILLTRDREDIDPRSKYVIPKLIEKLSELESLVEPSQYIDNHTSVNEVEKVKLNKFVEEPSHEVDKPKESKDDNYIDMKLEKLEEERIWVCDVQDVSSLWRSS